MFREAAGDPVAMCLERATRQDIPAVVALMNSAFRGVGPQASWNTEAEHIDGDRTSQALLREELAAKPDAILLVARSDAALIASVWVAPLDQGR